MAPLSRFYFLIDLHRLMVKFLLSLLLNLRYQIFVHRWSISVVMTCLVILICVIAWLLVMQNFLFDVSQFFLHSNEIIKLATRSCRLTIPESWHKVKLSREKFFIFKLFKIRGVLRRNISLLLICCFWLIRSHLILT